MMDYPDRKSRSEMPTAQMETPASESHVNRFATPVSGLPTAEDKEPHA